ncbi:thioredoxin reductase glit [Lojkania enalia]|uniref:Thioredoxin reductase glit n=1 Tax=Lojkania enalia TaxID=147567 RepID=A0A9P4KBA6_9PLEO|nr:thioredoxin reductase glit [Didymosphaeria enalia]
MNTEVPSIVDVLVVGGSHAGLSTALTLYRALHTCIIFDSKNPRNKYSTPIHLTPTWDHKHLDELKEASKKELRASGIVDFIDVEIVKVEKTNDGLFRATGSDGQTWIGRKLLLASGSKDKHLNIPGYSEIYAHRIYPCMFQFGYEQKGCPSAGLLAIEGLGNVPHATMLADDGNKFASKMTIYTNQNPILEAEITASLQTPDIVVDDRKIKRLRTGDGPSDVVIDFDDGTSKVEGFLVHRPETELDRTLVDQLGLKVSARGDIEVMPPFCQTSVFGVYAAGDCASPMKIIPNAISMGAYAGCGIARELPNRVTGRIIQPTDQLAEVEPAS